MDIKHFITQRIKSFNVEPAKINSSTSENKAIDYGLSRLNLLQCKNKKMDFPNQKAVNSEQPKSLKQYIINKIKGIYNPKLSAGGERKMDHSMWKNICANEQHSIYGEKNLISFSTFKGVDGQDKKPIQLTMSDSLHRGVSPGGKKGSEEPLNGMINNKRYAGVWRAKPMTTRTPVPVPMPMAPKYFHPQVTAESKLIINPQVTTVSKLIINHDMLKNKAEFVGQGINQKEKEGLSRLFEITNSSINKLIDDAMNNGLKSMEEDISLSYSSDGQMRQIINGFITEIYSRVKDEFGTECRDAKVRNEFFREIGLIAKNAGLDVKETSDGIFVPTAAGTNVYHNLVANSFRFLESRKDVSETLNERKPEIRKETLRRGLELITPMAKKLGYPDPTVFRDELTQTASRYRNIMISTL